MDITELEAIMAMQALEREAFQNRINALIETPDEFESWLSTFDGRAEVGLTNSYRSCPIARFGRDRLGQSVGVTNDTIEVYTHEVALPGWAQLFVDQVDALAEGFGDGDVLPVTAAEARAALALVKLGYAWMGSVFYR